MKKPELELDDWIDLLDLEALAEPSDKVNEAEYFLDLASKEVDVQRFRWLISAFFGAAYSFFETSALAAFHGFTNPETGGAIADDKALEVLRRYVKIVQNIKNPYFVKTGGLHPITAQLYELRKRNTHYYPMSIMAAGPSLPIDFQFGNLMGHGTPALAFCRESMSLIRTVQTELQVV
jgi:hypothetical protein